MPLKPKESRIMNTTGWVPHVPGESMGDFLDRWMAMNSSAAPVTQKPLSELLTSQGSKESSAVTRQTRVLRSRTIEY